SNTDCLGEPCTAYRTSFMRLASEEDYRNVLDSPFQDSVTPAEPFGPDTQATVLSFLPRFNPPAPSPPDPVDLDSSDAAMKIAVTLNEGTDVYLGESHANTDHTTFIRSLLGNDAMPINYALGVEIISDYQSVVDDYYADRLSLLEMYDEINTRTRRDT